MIFLLSISRRNKLKVERDTKIWILVSAPGFASTIFMQVVNKMVNCSTFVRFVDASDSSLLHHYGVALC
jgi:hypothetical protein